MKCFSIIALSYLRLELPHLSSAKGPWEGPGLCNLKGLSSSTKACWKQILASLQKKKTTFWQHQKKYLLYQFNIQKIKLQ